MDKITESAVANVSKEALINSRQYFMDENIRLSNELYKVKKLVISRIAEYEKKLSVLEKEEETKYTFMAISNIQYELDFLKSLL